VTLRAPWVLHVVSAGLVVNALNLARHHPLWLLGVPLGLGALVTYLRIRTVVDERGISVHRVRSSRHLAWADVAALRHRGGGALAAVTRDGEEVVLPWAEWRAPWPHDPEHAYPRSGQAIAGHARAAGYDIPLEDAAR